jgi:TRAP-type uncharacterized transport system fused permease subunit
VLRPKRYRLSLNSLFNGLRTMHSRELILAAIGIIVQMLVTTGLGTHLSHFMIEV